MNFIKNFNRAEKYTRYSVLVIILFSIIVLSLTSIYHVSGDGCWHIPVGKFISNNLKIPLFEPLGRDEPFWSPPLYHFFVAAVYYVFSAFSSSIANFAVKLISPIFGILSLAFSFLVIKRLFSPKTAFYSLIFLSFIPIFIDYSVISYVESTLLFFAVLSVYFLINDKVALAGIAAGLSILTKYNGVFMLPVLLFILHKKSRDKKAFYRNAAAILIIASLIAVPWFLRNWILLGNPIWPFLNFAFNGIQPNSYAKADFSAILNPDLYISTYLGFFGVPDGNYKTIMFFSIPYLKPLLAIWLIGTFVFMMPLVMGIFSIKKHRRYPMKFLIVWILSYIALFLLYAVNAGFYVSRMLLPAFPAVAVLWALGYEKLAGKANIKKITMLFLILIIAGFVSSEFAKIKLAANEWDAYADDFNWVKSNTDENAVFIANGQCVPYNIERTALYATPENLAKADYVWLNQNFKLDKKSVLDEQTLKSIQSKNYKIAYSSKKTGTIIYSTRQ